MSKSKFKLLKAPSESDLLRVDSSAPLEIVEFYWEDVKSVFIQLAKDQRKNSILLIQDLFSERTQFLSIGQYG
jgi:hypothetical protein